VQLRKYFSTRITEKIAAIVPIKGTTKGSDLLEGVNGILNRIGLYLTNLSVVSADGSIVLEGRGGGFDQLMEGEANKRVNISVMR
jgi:hypothetical protein